MNRSWVLGAAGLLALFGALAAIQFVGWGTTSREARAKQDALDVVRADLNRIKAGEAAAEQEVRKELDPAMSAEAEVTREFRAALAAAREPFADKGFAVRVTGPVRAEPGAPNTWRLEPRPGAATPMTALELVVKDADGMEVFRQTHGDAGGAVLTLPTAAWGKVKPGADLFLEVSAPGNDKGVPIERIPLARPVYVTHLATDKPVYKPGEAVRFRSLTLDRSTLRPPGHDLHLKFRLRDPADAPVPLDEGNGRLLASLKPVLGPDGKPLRGIGVGEHTIPAEAPGGEYKLDLFEVDAGREVLLETRKFLVNRYTPDTFEKKLEFDGKSYGPGDAVQARIEVSRTAGGPMTDARADVVASANGRVIHEQKGATFAVVPAEAGGSKAVLNVRFKLPPDVFENLNGTAPNAVLSVTVRDGSDTENIIRPIPLVTKNLSVAFFPEGGEMVEGVPGRLYFQARTPHGKPADLKGYVTDGTTTVAEVATLTDAESEGVNRGQGVFALTPRPGAKYFLKITSPAGIAEPTKDGFPLPAAKADGVALTALDPITKQGAGIRVRVQTANGPKPLHLGAYARGRLLAHVKLDAETGKPLDIALQGFDTTGGVTRVTVFEEVKGDGGATHLVPRAERLVYRKPAEQLVLDANPDKARYTPGGKVRLDLTARTENGTATPAVLLVGVVNRSVIAMADNKTDRLMPTHFLLAGEVKHPAELEHADFLLTEHPKAAVALDLLLGTQGWRRFAEQGGPPADAADRAEVDRMLAAMGRRAAAVELLRLEEQRIAAEFQPRVEQVRLRVAAAEGGWATFQNKTGREYGQKVAAAEAAVSHARNEYTESAASLYRFETRFLNPRSWPLPLFLIGTLGLALAGVAVAARKPESRRPYLAAAAVAFALFGVGVAGTTFTRGTEAAAAAWQEERAKKETQTFTFTGQAVWPAGEERAARGGALLDRMDAAVPVAAGFAPAPRGDAGDMPKAAPDPKNRSVADREVAERAKAEAELAVAAAGQGRAARDARAAEQVREKAKLADALRARPAPLAGTRGGRRPAREAVAGDVRMPPTEPTIPAVPPFVVREYAHQRDPSLGEVRSDFTETVYWHPVLVLPDTGTAAVEFQLSDDIARYQVLVAGHTLDGRIGAITKTIEARKPFSVDPKLPLEISHTDEIFAPIRVTNDTDSPRTVLVSTTPVGLKGESPATADGVFRAPLGLVANGKGRAFLRLKADRLKGDAGLLVEGTSGPDKDSVARTLRIVPDGFPGVGSFSDMIEGRTRGTVALPKDVVPGTLKVRLEVYPTTMADLVNGLDGLLREPGGCFEQTSTSNYPNTMILDYMNQMNQTNPEAAARAKGYLDRGYARLVGFECPDTKLAKKHGFEWFGAADMAHEALTAYGLLQFKDMSRVHAVDPELIKRTQQFLLAKRDGTGGFNRNPRGLDKFGGAAKHTTEAYIVWALVESDPDDAEKMDLAKEIAAIKAMALDENSAAGKDPYFVALVANVLLLRDDRAAAHQLLDRLRDKHAKDGPVTGAVTSITRSGGRDLDIETTALTLLGWLRANDPKYVAAVKAATRWIGQQRGGYGGFGSTQSTILALKALVYAKKSARPAESGELTLLVDGKPVASRTFTREDLEVIGLDIPNPETIFKPGEATEVEIATTAKQPYPFALSYTYTTLTPVSAEKCAVRIATALGRAEAVEGETVPLRLTLENKQQKGQGMAVAIVGLPAGMRVPTDLKQLTDLREKGQVSYFETRGRELILYWRELAPGQKVALTVDLVCDVPGVYRGPASRGYLYYDADHKHWVEPLAVTIKPTAGRE